MTGSCLVRGQPAPKYKSFSVDEASWPPKYTKLELALSDGGRLAYCDPRRFGRVKLRGADAWCCSYRPAISVPSTSRQRC